MPSLSFCALRFVDGGRSGFREKPCIFFAAALRFSRVSLGLPGSGGGEGRVARPGRGGEWAGRKFCFMDAIPYFCNGLRQPCGAAGPDLSVIKTFRALSSTIELRNFENPGRDGNESVCVGCVLSRAPWHFSGCGLNNIHRDVGWLRVAYPWERQCEGLMVG